MLYSGRLNDHLAEIDKKATEMCEELLKRFAKLKGITEKHKAEDQIKWVRAMNSIKNRVEEVILDELIYA